jgi:hypothetical protein
MENVDYNIYSSYTSGGARFWSKKRVLQKKLLFEILVLENIVIKQSRNLKILVPTPHNSPMWGKDKNFGNTLYI